MPVRIFDCNHEPGNPANSRDRWPSTIRAAEVAGQWYDPTPRDSRQDPFAKDLTEDPVGELWERQWATAAWKAAVPIPAWQYKFMTADIAYSRLYRPLDPRLDPYRAVKAENVPMPEFGETS